METAATIAIILLAATVAWLAYKCVALSYKVGKYETERDKDIVPEIEHLRATNERMLHDIEAMAEGDEAIMTFHKNRLRNRKSMQEHMESFRTSKTPNK